MLRDSALHSAECAAADEQRQRSECEALRQQLQAAKPELQAICTTRRTGNGRVGNDSRSWPAEVVAEMQKVELGVAKESERISGRMSPTGPGSMTWLERLERKEELTLRNS